MADENMTTPENANEIPQEQKDQVSPFESTEPLSDEEYSSLIADITLDRAKTVLRRMQAQFEVERVDYDLAQLDAMRAALDRRRVQTLIAAKPEAATEETK